MNGRVIQSLWVVLALVAGIMVYFKADWPTNFIGGLVALLAAIGGGWFISFLSRASIQSLSTPRQQVQAAEERIEQFIRQRKQDVFKTLPWVVIGGLMFGAGFWCYFTYYWPTNIVLFFALALSGVISSHHCDGNRPILKHIIKT